MPWRTFTADLSLVVMTLVLAAAPPAQGAEHEAASAADVARLAGRLKPGDAVVLRDGVWTDQQITLEVNVNGTADQPITLRAQTPGHVILTGTSSLTLAGRYLVATGLFFKAFTGDQATIAVPGSHCRVTECAMENGTSKTYVHLEGPENRLDHCYLAGKTSEAPTLQVEAPNGAPPGNNRIDHNHFGYRPPLKKNGGETIRIGYSHQATNVSRTVCESNLFERCDGENEIVSNKSCENVYRNNTFLESVGMLTMRHGDRCVVDGNFFFGRGKKDAGGIRLCGEDHVVTNNYIEGVDAGAFRFTTGKIDPQPKDHHQARNCLIAYNTVVDCAGIYLHMSIGYDEPTRILRPAGMILANNVFDLHKNARLLDGIEGKDNRWMGNFVGGDGAPNSDRAGLHRVDLQMRKSDDGTWRPAADSPVRGAAVAGPFPRVERDIDGQARGERTDAGCDQASNEPVTRRPLTAGDVGPSWMPRTARAAGSPDERSPGPQSQWVHFDRDGKLAYKSLDAGDRIIDFSSAGYRGGGVALPSVPVRKTLAPSGSDAADDSQRIQDAIDAVSAMPLVDGVRGAVLLEAGTFNTERTLAIRASGVVLRGSGSGDGGTTIRMAGRPHQCIRIQGQRSPQPAADSTRITDRYVPAGADSFSVADAAGFKPGDTVLVAHPVTKAWVHFMDMDTLVRDGKKQTWVRGTLRTERRIKSVNGQRIALDAPLTDSLDARYLDPPGAEVAKADTSGRITEVGVESLRITAPPLKVTIDEPHYRAVSISAASDAWLKDLRIDDTMNSVSVNGGTARVTLESLRLNHEVPALGSAKPADIAVGGTQVLVHRCTSSGDNLFQFATHAGVAGPVVVLHCTFGGNGRVQPHQRWATGILVDNCTNPDGGIDFMDRGSMGSGHGWAAGWSVAWNCRAKLFLIQQPPGSMNWAIGCIGAPEDRPRPFGKTGEAPNMPRGTFDSHGVPVAPQSLYLAQLRERLGPKALEAIGYSSDKTNE